MQKLEYIDRSAKNTENQAVLDLARVLHHPNQENIISLLERLDFVETRAIARHEF